MDKSELENLQCQLVTLVHYRRQEIASNKSKTSEQKAIFDDTQPVIKNLFLKFYTKQTETEYILFKSLLLFWIEQLSEDDDPDSRNLCLVVLTEFIRHSWHSSVQISIDLLQLLQTAINEEFKHNKVAALVAAFHCSVFTAAAVISDNISPGYEQSLRILLLTCLRNYSKSSLVLSRVSKFYLSFPSLLPESADDKQKLSNFVVDAVAAFYETNVQTTEHMESIGQLVFCLCDQKSPKHILSSLNYICNYITSRKADDPLSPAMAHLLTIIPRNAVVLLEATITTSEPAIVKQCFQNVLCRLTIWLVKWPNARQTLLYWLAAHVQTMIKHDMTDTLVQATVAVLPKLKFPMRISVLREDLLKAVILLLLAIKHSNVAYQKCFPLLLHWASLLAVDAVQNNVVRQNFSDLCHCIVKYFPVFDATLNPTLLNAIKDFPAPSCATPTELVQRLELLGPPAAHHVSSGVLGGDAVGPNGNTLSWTDDVVRNSMYYQIAIDAQLYVPTQVELPEETIIARTSPIGLHNLGATCYYNAIMQALFNTDMFRHGVLTMSSIVCESHLHMQRLYCLQVFTPLDCLLPSKQMVQASTPEHFVFNQQQDASEFLTCLLDSFKENEIKCNKDEEHESKMLTTDKLVHQYSVAESAPPNASQSPSEVTNSTMDTNASTSLSAASFQGHISYSSVTNRDQFADLLAMDAKPVEEESMSHESISSQVADGAEDELITDFHNNKINGKGSQAFLSSGMDVHDTADDDCVPENNNSVWVRMEQVIEGDSLGNETSPHRLKPAHVCEGAQTKNSVNAEPIDESNLPDQHEEFMNFQKALFESMRSPRSVLSEAHVVNSFDRSLKRKSSESFDEVLAQPLPLKTRDFDSKVSESCNKELSSCSHLSAESPSDSDSGISIQDDQPNSGTPTTADGVTEEEEDMDEDSPDEAVTKPSVEQVTEHSPNEEAFDQQNSIVSTESEQTPRGYCTLVQRAFVGELVRLTHCLNCRSITTTRDTSADFKLSFKDNTETSDNLVSVEEMLGQALNKQKLMGSDQYDCVSCKGKQDAEIYTAFTEPPNCLILTQNRFIFNFVRGEEDKNLTPVDFEETIELPVWKLNKLKQCIKVSAALTADVSSCDALQSTSTNNNNSLDTPQSTATSSDNNDESNSSEIVNSEQSTALNNSGLQCGESGDAEQSSSSGFTGLFERSEDVSCGADSSSTVCETESKNLSHIDSESHSLSNTESLAQSHCLSNTESCSLTDCAENKIHSPELQMYTPPASPELKKSVTCSATELSCAAAHSTAVSASSSSSMLRDSSDASDLTDAGVTASGEVSSPVEVMESSRISSEGAADSLTSFKPCCCSVCLARTVENGSLISPDRTVLFVLYAIVVHSGQFSRAGHYYCYARSSSQAVKDLLYPTHDVNRSTSQWMELNDGVAQTTTFSKMKALLTRRSADCAPYLMFYQRVPDCVQECAALAPSYDEESFASLPPYLQCFVRAHVYHHTRTKRVPSVNISRDGSFGEDGGSSNFGGRTGGCGDGAPLGAPNLIC